MQQAYHVGKGILELQQGSVTQYHADALVCPANGDLEIVACPGGVQYAFLKEGGEEIFREASRLGKKLRSVSMDTTISFAAPEASAHLTKAGRLPANHVIHSVAVGYDPKKEGLYCNRDLVGRSTKNALELANSKKLQSIGFPALGSGLYGVPLDEVVESMVREFKLHLHSKISLERVGLVLYSSDQFQVGRRIFDKNLLAI